MRWCPISIDAPELQQRQRQRGKQRSPPPIHYPAVRSGRGGIPRGMPPGPDTLVGGLFHGRSNGNDGDGGFCTSGVGIFGDGRDPEAREAAVGRGILAAGPSRVHPRGKSREPCQHDCCCDDGCQRRCDRLPEPGDPLPPRGVHHHPETPQDDDTRAHSSSSSNNNRGIVVAAVPDTTTPRGRRLPPPARSATHRSFRSSLERATDAGVVQTADSKQ
mmetsp:Transcript_21931/g.48570  ORF Transcript_21931/g.48570 Transcript_21931/m.48570 type:complete len:217 (+) Transcript_21931:192-842(+)